MLTFACRRILVLGIVLVLSSCKPNVRPDKPEVCVAEPVVITRTVERYVEIDDRFTTVLPIAHGEPSAIGDTARDRKVQLLRCNADRAAVGSIQGTVP